MKKIERQKLWNHSRIIHRGYILNDNTPIEGYWVEGHRDSQWGCWIISQNDIQWYQVDPNRVSPYSGSDETIDGLPSSIKLFGGDIVEIDYAELECEIESEFKGVITLTEGQWWVLGETQGYPLWSKLYSWRKI